MVSIALLQTPPEIAAARIVRGIPRREKRVLVGRDARRMAAAQRLFPVDYWPMIARTIACKVRRLTQNAA